MLPVPTVVWAKTKWGTHNSTKTAEDTKELTDFRLAVFMAATLLPKSQAEQKRFIVWIRADIVELRPYRDGHKVARL
jgi:hypothetical protein